MPILAIIAMVAHMVQNSCFCIQRHSYVQRHFNIQRHFYIQRLFYIQIHFYIQRLFYIQRHFYIQGHFYVQKHFYIRRLFLFVEESIKGKSSRLQMFFKIGILKNFAISTGKRLCCSQSLFN